MREELYDPDCFACERAQQDQLELEQVVDDLATLVLRLVRDLRKAAPDNELTAKALDYLKRKALTGSPLREFDGEGSKPGDAVMTVEQAVTVLRQHNAWRRGRGSAAGRSR